jgi:hypothetical protein
MALSNVVKKILGLRKILEDFRMELEAPTTIYVKNISNINLSKNVGFSKRTKHIEIRFYFTMEQ